MTRISSLLLLMAVACSKAEPTAPADDKTPGPGVTPKAPEVKVELAGVTLADDCAEGIPTKPIAPPSIHAPPAAAAGSGMQLPGDAPAASMARGACATPGGCSMPAPACEQTAMQLSVQVPAGANATKLKVKRVELLDDAGKTVGTLTARAPSKWDGNAYVTWDEAIAAGKSDFAISYKLTSPEWNKIGAGGRWAAAGKKFTLRVTVTVSDKDRTVEKQSIVVVQPEPAVVT